MKKTGNLVIIISSLLIVIGVIVGSALTKYSSEISTITTTVTAIIGAVALWFQFKKDREINQSSFVIEFYKSFNESNEGNKIVLDQLDKKFDNMPYTSLKDLRTEVLAYMYWVRTLCNLIDRGVFTFDSIDSIFAYKFFSFVNNKEVQEMEINVHPEVYTQVFAVHKKWSKFRSKHGYKPYYPEEDLSNSPFYNQD